MVMFQKGTRVHTCTPYTRVSTKRRYLPSKMMHAGGIGLVLLFFAPSANAGERRFVRSSVDSLPVFLDSPRMLNTRIPDLVEARWLRLGCEFVVFPTLIELIHAGRTQVHAQWRK